MSSPANIIAINKAVAEGVKESPPSKSIVDSAIDFLQRPEWVRDEDLHMFLSRATEAVIWLILASLSLLILSRLLTRIFSKHMAPQASALVMKIIRISGWAFIFVETFSILGFNIITVLGAASIVGVAVGFASQASLSNIISGLFLVGERQINLGDIIDIQGIRGSVDAINLLSVQLRMPDNTLVRVPNEMIIKTPVSNLTRYDTRRCDIELSVDYSTSFDHLLEVVHRVLDENPMCLDDPEPTILFTGFGESSIDFKVGAWCKTEYFQQFRMTLAKTIKRELDKEGISIPFPVRSMEAKHPIQVSIVQEQANKN